MTLDEITCKGIAQALAPIDTGNLRFNAIKSRATQDGFAIVYSLQDAYYIRLLEEGITTMRHFGFIANRTVPAIAGYLHAKYASKNNARVAMFKDMATFGHSYMAEENIQSWYDKQTREQRHEMSIQTDIHDVYDEIEPTDRWYEQYNPNFETQNYLFRRKGL